MKLVLAAVLALAAPAALADVDAVIDSHILPGVAAFADATDALADAAQADCTPPALKPGFNAAFDAWLGISHLQLGPVLEKGRAQAIAFWPDTRGATPATLNRLIADADPAAGDPAEFAEVSVAARGLFALEMMLYDPAFFNYETGSYPCALTRALTTDLADMAQAVSDGWTGDYADQLRSAGQPGNTVFLSTDESAQALFTALLSGLEFTKDQRLGRPLGTFERPRPTRAEARRAGRSLRNVELSLTALRDLADALAEGQAPQTDAAFDAALAAAARVGDPTFADIDDPQARLKLEIVQQRAAAISEAVQAEIGPQLGVAAGFNSADGD
ncbi:imelysin family protein [Actibacterium sp. D379-3]